MGFTTQALLPRCYYPGATTQVLLPRRYYPGVTPARDTQRVLAVETLQSFCCDRWQKRYLGSEFLGAGWSWRSWAACCSCADVCH
jgi:hypothetical protein